MKLLLVILLVGIVSQSQGNSYEDGHHLSGEWNHGPSSHEYSVGSESSEVALADDDVELANSGESNEQEKPKHFNKGKIVVHPLIVDPARTKKPDLEWTLKPLTVPTRKPMQRLHFTKPTLRPFSIGTVRAKVLHPIYRKLNSTTVKPALPTSSSEENDY